jgi:SlyX protein
MSASAPPTSSDDRSDERLTELEIKLTHQEQLLETLNQVVVEHQAQIEIMRERIEGFARVLANSDEEPANDPPPHY